MPTQLVEVASFRVLFTLNDELMFLEGDCSLWLKANFRPKAPGNERPGKPIHRQAKVVEFPQVDIGADCARLEAGKQMLRLRFDNYTAANQVQCRFLCRPPPAILGRTSLRVDDGVQGVLPRSR